MKEKFQNRRIENSIIIKMDIGDYIPNTPDEADEKKKTRVEKKSPRVLAAEVHDANELTRKRDILVTEVLLGGLESYIGEKITASQIRKMKKEKLESYFLLYQEKAGQETTNEMMSSLVEMSVKGLSYVVDIDNQEDLKNDLVNNKQLRRTIGKQVAGITEKYGDVVAFAKVLFTVGKHLSFSASTITDSASTMLAPASTITDSASTMLAPASTITDCASTITDSASTC